MTHHRSEKPRTEPAQSVIPAADDVLAQMSTGWPDRWYRWKVRLLGPPLTSASLTQARLPLLFALGVLASDCISSSAYGTEEMLIELLPRFGSLGFTLVLPTTAVILVILLLLTLCYRQVVRIYTKAGGSYAVAKENFGPRVAQIAAVALLIDYVVTVAIQASAGTVAVASAIPALGPYSLEITVGVVLVLAFGNLRGVREAGRTFAFPTYLFVVCTGGFIGAGLIRAFIGNLPRYEPAALPGTIAVQHETGVSSALLALTLLRAFANGGSSLTGLEAISNGVSIFRPPASLNARKALAIMAATLGFLVAGVSLLAHMTHATPYRSGYPSVVAQEAQAVLSGGPLSHAGFLIVQAATALILYTGANTSFNGFPYLASFVAEDSFLPRQLTKRGHRLVFSNGILVLTAVCIALLLFTGAKVNSLVPFYAIGVFTGFTMAGFGMARYHNRHQAAGWRRRLAVSLAAGALSLLVVLVFAVVKFTEGAWLVVVVFPVLVAMLIRVNRRYRDEAAALATYAPVLDAGPNGVQHVVIVLVDELDLAILRALRYARVLRPSALYAVHLVIDNAHADRLSRRWLEFQRGDIPLQLRDCPDRRLAHGAVELTRQVVVDHRTEVTVVLPRRAYKLAFRVLHSHRADHIAAAINRLPHAVATIVPFDVDAAIKRLKALHQLDAGAPTGVPSNELLGPGDPSARG